MEKLPLYFRRAAINDAIRIWRSQKKETISQKTLTKEENSFNTGDSICPFSGKLLPQVFKPQEKEGVQKGLEDKNKRLKEKIRNLTDSYAHRVSRRMVDFCEEEGLQILVVPNYKQPINLNKRGYLSATSYDWLGRRIIGQLRYKAFSRGIEPWPLPENASPHSLPH